MISIGNRIFTEFDRPDSKLINEFRGIPSSNINDEMNRLFCMHEYIKLQNPNTSKPLVGTALTVKVPIGDNLFFHKALDLAQPGDVIVVDGASGVNRSLVGEIMIRFASKKGLAGLVIDGCIRDLDTIETMEIPVYAIGATPQGPYKNGPGEINTPISCGGQVVFPGDIIVGDRDGVVVIRRQDAEVVLEASKKKYQSEQKTFELMDSDLESYMQKHDETTEKRLSKSGQAVERLNKYEDIY